MAPPGGGGGGLFAGGIPKLRSAGAAGGGNRSFGAPTSNARPPPSKSDCQLCHQPPSLSLIF